MAHGGQLQRVEKDAELSGAGHVYATGIAPAGEQDAPRRIARHGKSKSVIGVRGRKDVSVKRAVLPHHAAVRAPIRYPTARARAVEGPDSHRVKFIGREALNENIKATVIGLAAGKNEIL